MKRQIVYPGSIPLDSDLLNTNRNTMVAIAKVATAMLGTATIVNGLACTPTSPASMQVQVAPGEIYSLANLDGTAYGSLSADTTHQILKQGILLDAATLSCPAPTTNGFSVNYLIEATYQDVDSNALVLPYYNASNPSQAFSGAGNNGVAQNTTRDGVCFLQVKAGIAATTGTQVTPPADSGYVGLWVVTVAYGQTTITSANIAQAVNAPFLPAGIVPSIQSSAMTFAMDAGTVNTYKAQYNPPVTQPVDGMLLSFKAKNTNTGAATFAPNNVTASPIYSQAHVALLSGEIAANGFVEVEWNSSLNGWVLCENTGGIAHGSTPATGDNSKKLATTEYVLNTLAGPLFASSVSGGYQKLPSGLIIQWGVIGQGGTAGTKIGSFPIAFPNSATVMAASATTESVGGVYFAGVMPISLTQFQFNITGYFQTSNGLWDQATSNTAVMRWIAIGY